MPERRTRPALNSRPTALRPAALLVALLAALLAILPATLAAQATPPQQLPSAPQPHTPADLRPCTPLPTDSDPATSTPTRSAPQPCTQTAKPPVIDWLARFLNGPQVKPLTPKEKARLAVRNLLDPFNAITILAQSAIVVGADAHSPYGPGMPGFARNVGVSYTQELTGEFFGTFLIPSLVHQDPHYHRMPQASIPRRLGHAIVQVVWTQGDNGRGMLNYANLLGLGIESEISNLYVPGIQSNGTATASRYAISIATSPIDNFITEFLPDVARRIHVRVVLVQRIINQVAKTEGGSGP
ncbi:MAG TPA: hypothetical protein VMV57_14250 [Terracidiphilus sp.]|nr:hypothetical protein [Terracidiphilus sp.]